MSISSSLSEPRKLRLLHEMGITVYLPRYRLPGAAPSPAAAWPEVKRAPAEPTTQARGAAPQAVPPPPELPAQNDAMPELPPLHAYEAEREAMEDPYAPEPAVRRAPKIAIVESEPARREAPAAPQPAAKPAVGATSPAAEAETRFQALLFPVSSELAVLALLPALARQQVQERERLLLSNILRWLGLSEPNLRGARPFQWPLPGFPGGGVALAGASLRAFLDQAQREEKFARVLVFGTLLREALEADGGLRELHATYSLQELVAVPALKRECWLSLGPLQQLLSVARNP